MKRDKKGIGFKSLLTQVCNACKSMMQCIVICSHGCCLHVKYIVYKHLNTSLSLGVCKVSDTYLLGCLRYLGET